MLSNFDVLEKYYPTMAKAAKQAEVDFRAGEFQHCARQLRAFLEIALYIFQKIDLTKDDKPQVKDLIKDVVKKGMPWGILQHCKSLQFEGNQASHTKFQANAQGRVEYVYKVYDKSSSKSLLRDAYEVAKWFVQDRDRSVKYPPFVTPDGSDIQHKEAPIPVAKTHFNKEQEEIIALHTGFHLVLAPPGCGKTAVLTERIAQAIDKGIDPEDMLCLTFTNRAARGMQERIAERIGQTRVAGCYVGNIHRFCSKFLFDKELVPETSAILDEEDSNDVVLRLLEENGITGLKADYKPYELGNILRYITTKADLLYLEARNFPVELRPALPELPNLLKNLSGQDLAWLTQGAKLFLEHKTEQNLLNFNDLLYQAYEELSKPNSAMKRYLWIQVDEVQDLSPLQLKLVELLWAKDQPGSVCVYLGDEQQAIFSFMGAKLAKLMELKTKETVLHRLFSNFRSPDYLLEVFNKFAVHELRCSEELLPKAMVHEPPPKQALQMSRFSTSGNEEEAVAEMIAQAPKGERTAILVSKNASADSMSQRLNLANIAHFKISGRDIFYYDAIKTATAYLDVLMKPYQYSPWAKLIYRLNKRDDVKLKDIRDFLWRKLPLYGLLPFDLMVYQSPEEDSAEPISYIDDFAKAYEGELVVFDTETTGLEVGVDEVVQIAAVKLQHGKVVDRFERFLKVSRPIPPMLGNIPNPMIEEYAKHKDQLEDPGIALWDFMDFVGDAPVVGHNVEYDCSIVDSQMLILQKQLREVEAQLGEKISAGRAPLQKRVDTLMLSYAFERQICEMKGLTRLKSHKLKDMIATLGLAGVNSHKADDDVEATVNLLEWFYTHADERAKKRREFRNLPKIRTMSERLRTQFLDLYLSHKELMFWVKDPESEAVLVQVFREFIEWLPRYTEQQDEIATLLTKLPVIYRYLDQELINKEAHRTLYAQLQAYQAQIAALRETDLCGSSVMEEKIFISTVHKAKGLEFENVIVMNVVDGVYPFFSSKTTEEQLEDARKLYAAMTRAKKTLHITYNEEPNWAGYPRKKSPFLPAIEEYFNINRGP